MRRNQRDETLAAFLAPYASRVEADLERWLVEDDVPSPVAEAMRYSVLGGGKRLRPALVWMAAEASGMARRRGEGSGSARRGTRRDAAAEEMTGRSAVAVELVHCYSLVHDDLPAMDDDTLRRGRPTVHVQFGEAMAILAGDALLTRAFGVLAEADDPRAGRLAAELALAAGPAGMIAGQAGDMNLCPVPEGLTGLRYVHLRKTAALIRAAGRMGAICGGADAAALQAITEWAESLGLAFQLVDDILDVTGDVAHLGKTPGKDARAGKRTVVSELGLERSIRMGRALSEQAAAALKPLGSRARNLRKLVRLLADRAH